MPLGHSSISSVPISGAVLLSRGLVLQAVTGLGTTVSLGSVTAKGVVTGAEATGVESVVNVPSLGSIKHGDFIAVFLQTEAIKATLGPIASAVGTGEVAITGMKIAVELSNSYIVNGLFVNTTGVAATGVIGSTGQEERQKWLKITPSSSPGWVEITVKAKVE